MGTVPPSPVSSSQQVSVSSQVLLLLDLSIHSFPSKLNLSVFGRQLPSLQVISATRPPPHPNSTLQTAAPACLFPDRSAPNLLAVFQIIHLDTKQDWGLQVARGTSPEMPPPAHTLASALVFVYGLQTSLWSCDYVCTRASRTQFC